MTGSTDPYVYPGTTVLKNLRELRETEALATFEAQATANRIRKLIRKPIQGKFDVAHLCAIHRYIFQDVFAWAGEIRSVSISKGGFFFAAVAAYCRTKGSGADEGVRPPTTASKSHVEGGSPDPRATPWSRRLFVVVTAASSSPAEESASRPEASTAAQAWSR